MHLIAEKHHTDRMEGADRIKSPLLGINISWAYQANRQMHALTTGLDGWIPHPPQPLFVLLILTLKLNCLIHSLSLSPSFSCALWHVYLSLTLPLLSVYNLCSISLSLSDMPQKKSTYRAALSEQTERFYTKARRDDRRRASLLVDVMRQKGNWRRKAIL